MDGVDFRIQEPRSADHPSQIDTIWFSHKFNGPGMRYEIGLCVKTGHIVWAYGGYPAGEYSDLALARLDFVNHLLPHERVIADRIYQDPAYFINQNIDPLTIRIQKQILARHETINKR